MTGGPEVEIERDPGEETDRFRTWVAVVIAGISIIGAVVAWRGALVSNSAGAADQAYIQELAEQQQQVTLLTSRVDEDVRQVGMYSEHVRAAQLLRTEADAAQARFPDLAVQLRLEAQAEQTLASQRRLFITAGIPEVTKDPANPVKYDRAQALRDLEQRDGDLQKLHPDATRAVASKLHDKAQDLVILVTLFVAALFFLTLSQFTNRQGRRVFAGAGIAVTVVAALAWVVVEVMA